MTNETMRRALIEFVERQTKRINEIPADPLYRSGYVDALTNVMAVVKALAATQDRARSWEAGREAAALVVLDHCPYALGEQLAAAIRALRPPAGSGGVLHKVGEYIADYEPLTAAEISKPIPEVDDLIARSKPATAPSPDERAKLAVIQGIATELATELDSLFERFLSAHGASKEDDLRQFLWNNKVGFLRIAQSLVALRTTPAPAVSEEEMARKIAYLRMCEKQGNVVPCASCNNARGSNDDVGCMTLARAALFNPAPISDDLAQASLARARGD